MCLGIPSKVMSIEKNIGKVDFGGVIKEVNLSLVENVKIGDYVLIHAGYALQIIDDSEAQETLRLLNEVMELGRNKPDYLN